MMALKRIKESMIIAKYKAAAHSICNLRYDTKRKYLWLSTSGQTMTYHFITKQLMEGFKKQFE